MTYAGSGFILPVHPTDVSLSKILTLPAQEAELFSWVIALNPLRRRQEKKIETHIWQTQAYTAQPEIW